MKYIIKIKEWKCDVYWSSECWCCGHVTDGEDTCTFENLVWRVSASCLEEAEKAMIKHINELIENSIEEEDRDAEIDKIKVLHEDVEIYPARAEDQMADAGVIGLFDRDRYLVAFSPMIEELGAAV